MEVIGSVFLWRQVLRKIETITDTHCEHLIGRHRNETVLKLVLYASVESSEHDKPLYNIVEKLQIKSVEFVHRESEKLRQVDDGIIRRVKVVERFSQVQERPFHSDEVAEGEESTKGALSSRLVIEKTKDFFQLVIRI